MKKRMLGLLLVLALLAAALCTTVFAAGGAVYVSAGGSDTTGDGSQANPYATLAKAVEVAEDGSTIYVMSNLTMTKCARFYDKSLTITSLGGKCTITRGGSFDTISDTARSWYNPAMIEVQTTLKGAGLTLTNIILDDADKHEGTVFAQAISGEAKTDNTVYVQDAMIASNATYPTTITLGDGAVLRNFGGMSAVRVTGQAKLVMKSGSVIEDTDSHTTRTRGKADGEVGPAGAVWIQGASFEMEAGAKIQNVDGRAVYVDGGSAIIGGTISNITANSQMWQGNSGVAIHLRNKATGTLLQGGVIEGISGKDSSAISVTIGTLNCNEGSEIRNCDSIGILSVTCNSTWNNGRNIVNFNGEIYGTRNNKNPFQIGYTNITIGEKAEIHDNTANYGALYLQRDLTADIYGKIYNNTSGGRGGGIGTAGHSKVEINIYDGAEIKNNTANNTGGGISLKKAKLTMYGGEISGNSTKKIGGGIYLYEDAVADLRGGPITGNTDKNGSNDLAVTDNRCYATSTNNYLFISDDMTIGNKAVYFEKDSKTVTPADTSFDIKLGNANSNEAYPGLQAASISKGWGGPRAIFWAQRNGAATLTVGGLTLTDTLPVYVLTLPIDAEDGKPTDTEAKCYAATRTADGVQFTIPEADLADGGCAIAIVQPSTDYGTLDITAPESITENETGEDYTVTYTVTYTISDSLKSIIKESNVEKVSYDLALSPDTRLTGTVYTSSFDGENNSITATYTLPNGNFAANKSLCTSAVLTVTVGNSNYVIPSNVAETKMLPLFPEEDEGGEDKPNQPTGGFFFPMGEEHMAYVSGYFASGAQTPADVTTSDWYYSIVSQMVGSGYLTGYADGTFRGNNNVTRAEFVTMLVRLSGAHGGWCSFTDVSSAHWAYDAISTAAAEGWIGGYADGSFRPDQAITRAEAMTIINRALGRGVDETSWLGDYINWPDNHRDAWYYYEVIEATNDHYYTGSRPNEDWVG